MLCERLHLETLTPVSDIFDIAGLLHLPIGVPASAPGLLGGRGYEDSASPGLVRARTGDPLSATSKMARTRAGAVGSGQWAVGSG